MLPLDDKHHPATVHAFLDDPQIPTEMNDFLAESEAIVRRGSLQEIGNSRADHWVSDFGGRQV